MPYAVSNTNQNLNKLATDLAAAVDANYSALAKVFFYNKGLAGDDYKKWKNALADGTEAAVQSEILATSFQNTTYIDPFTSYQVFENIIWPAVSELSPGWTDHPFQVDGSEQQMLSGMRGVTFADVWGYGERDFQNSFLQTFQGFDVDISWLDKTKTIDQLNRVKTASNNLVTAYKQAGGVSTDISVRKDILYNVFSSEAAAKLFFIKNYLMSDVALNSPYWLMTIDPYLAYLTVLVGWLGGKGNDTTLGALDRCKNSSNKSLRNVLQNIAPQGNQWNRLPDADRYKTATATTEFLGVFYEWLQSISKQEKYVDLYRNWMAMFLSNRKSMVNMLVIVNERVNINNSNMFAIQPKARDFQLALSEAYKKFEMTIGD
jgi:hypothetical protein